MVSPRMCGVGSLFCTTSAAMDEESQNHLLNDSMNHPGMTCNTESTNIKKRYQSTLKVSESMSHHSDVSNHTSSHCSSCATDSLGEKVIIARPGLVIVRNAESMCIESTHTSDPSIMLFDPGVQVLSKDKKKMTFEYSSKCKYNSPLAMQLLKLRGVEQVTLTTNHIQVKKICHKHKDRSSEKNCSVSWRNLKPEIVATMIDFFSSGIPIIEEENTSCDSLVSLCEEVEDSSLIIRDLIESRIRPMVQQEGGDVIFIEYRRPEFHVLLSMTGTCISSPTATKVLKNVILQLLQFHLPEVSSIITVPIQV